VSSLTSFFASSFLFPCSILVILCGGGIYLFIFVMQHILQDSPPPTKGLLVDPKTHLTQSQTDHVGSRDFIFLSDIQKVKGKGTTTSNTDTDTNNDDNTNDDIDLEEQLVSPSTKTMEGVTTTTTTTTVIMSCAICLMDYAAGDEVCWSHNRRCNHHFHLACLSSWLVQQQRDDCPFCRNNYLALSEDEEEYDNNNYNNNTDSEEEEDNYEEEGSVERDRVGTVLVQPPRPPPRPNSPPPPTRTRSIRLEGEDPWTGVPMHFFDHQFSSILRPLLVHGSINDTSAMIGTRGPPYLMEASSVGHAPPTDGGGSDCEEEWDEGEFCHWNGASLESGTSSVATENGLMSYSNETAASATAEAPPRMDQEDDADMWSCVAGEIDDENDLEEDDVLNRILSPRWHRKKRQRPSFLRPSSEQVQNDDSVRLEQTINLDLSELIVEGLMTRLEDDKGNDEQTVSSGSVYLQRGEDGCEIEPNDGKQNQQQQALRDVKDDDDDALCRANASTVCAICRRGYRANEALCWSKDPGCDHVFHRQCLEDWIAAGNDVCPLCAVRGKDRIHPESNNNHDQITSLNKNSKKAHCHAVGYKTTQSLEDATRGVVLSLSGLGMNATESTLDGQQMRNTEKKCAEVNRPRYGGNIAASDTSPSWTRVIPLSQLVASQSSQDSPFEASEDDLWDFPVGNVVQGGCSDEENSQAMSIGSWSATSDMISASQSDKKTSVRMNDATYHAVLPIPISKTRQDSVKRMSHVKHSAGDIESSLAEWDSIIDTFARMNKLGLSPRGVNRIGSSQLASIDGDQK
jgi:hypothetical protein